MLVAHRENFVPRPEDGRPFWERMTLRERVSLNPLGKPLPPKLAHRAHPEIVGGAGQPQGRGRRISASAWTTARSRSSTSRCAPTGSSRTRSSRAAARTRATASCRSARAAPGGGCTRPGRRASCRDHYEANVVAEGARGDLVEDTRLRDYLAACPPEGVVPALALLVLRRLLVRPRSAGSAVGWRSRARRRRPSFRRRLPRVRPSFVRRSSFFSCSSSIRSRAWSRRSIVNRCVRVISRIASSSTSARSRSSSDSEGVTCSAPAGAPSSGSGHRGRSFASRSSRTSCPSLIPSSTAASSQISSAYSSSRRPCS